MFATHRSSYLILFIFLLIIIPLSFIFPMIAKKNKQVTDFLSCAKQYPVMESYPRQCKTPDGRSFVEKIVPSMTNNPQQSEPTDTIPSQQANITVSTPLPNQQVKNQFTLQGRARVFENILQYRLEDMYDVVLASGNIEAKSLDVGQFGDFTVRITHKPTKETKGLLTVFSYSPKDGSEINTVRVPVQFVR